MMSIELGELMGAVALRPGEWFWLLDSDTKFGDRQRHPWVFPTGFDPNGRTALGHALPRSSQPPFRDDRPGVDFLHHAAHGNCNGRQCELDREGWIKGQRWPVGKDWINRGSHICKEPLLVVLAEIQHFEANECR